MTDRKCDCAYFADTGSGEKPVKAWLEGLQSNRRAYDAIYRKVDLLERRGVPESITSGLLKHVRGEIFELKVKMKGAQPRVLGWYETLDGGRHRFWAGAAEMKDQRELEEQTIRRAEERLAIWRRQRGE